MQFCQKKFLKIEIKSFDRRNLISSVGVDPLQKTRNLIQFNIQFNILQDKPGHKSIYNF